LNAAPLALATDMSPQSKFVATFADPVFHHPHETLFDSTRFRRVTRYDGAGRDEF
jgi:hypothetical protein